MDEPWHERLGVRDGPSGLGGVYRDLEARVDHDLQKDRYLSRGTLGDGVSGRKAVGTRRGVDPA